MFDFDTIINRRGTNSLKWDIYKNPDIIPLWVADMDFQAPPAVLEALHKHVDHGIFGYSLPPLALKETIVEMLAKRHAWQVRPEWIVWLPGLVTGLNVTCLAVGEKDDAVLSMTPVYPPFLSAPAHSARRLITVDHVLREGGYGIDFDQLEQAITPDTRLFILCNPQNPTGRVFSRDELGRLAEICLRHDIIICSDEIHCDLILDQQKEHISIAGLGEDIARKTITLLAPSKTYNIPGLGCSFAVIPEDALRLRFKQVMEDLIPHVNALGLTAALAAYRDSTDWKAALLDYLRANHALVLDFIHRMPGLQMFPAEATYLAWIDARGLRKDNPTAFFEAAGVGLSNGSNFGAPGFVRLNFGCPRSLLQTALERMEKALVSI